MVEPGLYIAFLAATALLMAIPGPNVALIVAHSLRHGTRFGLLTVAGTSAAMVVQLGVVWLGMAQLLGALAGLFDWLRWLGVAYLLWLGLRHWRAPVVDLTLVPAQPRSAPAIFWRGALVSLTNPKTLVFYGAFFPQFVTPGVGAVGAQVLVLAVSFLAVAVVLDSAWALLAGRARPLLAAHGRLRNRVSGGLLVGAGVGLALARR
ncbi:MAG TPA: LysE family translocator [Acetobacteraceae bacterium]|jgi:threonine/homoserine/homoserine lactone efflux protein|nr:LysE family translocator [Acetobacteraceae bacterium]